MDSPDSLSKWWSLPFTVVSLLPRVPRFPMLDANAPALLSMNRHADFSPQGPGTAPRAWSSRERPTSPRSCGLKSACRVRFMAGEQVRKEQGPTHGGRSVRGPAGRADGLALLPYALSQSAPAWGRVSATPPLSGSRAVVLRAVSACDTTEGAIRHAGSPDVTLSVCWN